MLPELDGFQTCARLRKRDNGRHLPIVIISALDTEDSRQRGAEAGADAYFAKPFDPDEVIKTIRSLIGQADH
jgi:DNA-binding response OmpR family regulator